MDTTTQIDLLPVASLPDRYSKAKSQVYSRLNALGITTHKQGNKAYVDASQLQHLDAIHQLITTGHTLEEAASKVLGTAPNLTREPAAPLTVQDSPVAQSYETLERLIGLISTTPAPNPLARFEHLQALADHGWQPSTSELADILGLKSLGGKQFERYGFQFTRAGRNGQQSAWRVERITTS